MEKFERQITMVDIVMVSLAFVSLFILIYEDWADLNAAQRERLLLIDLTIVGIFAVEYLVRLIQAKERWRFVKGHWYELVGLIPVAAFRAFRLARLIRIVAIASRFMRVSDKTLGEGILQNRLNKYKDVVVEELTDPLVVAILGVAERSLSKGSYGTAIAKGLEKNRDSLVAHILEQMRKDTALSIILRTPGVGGALENLPRRIIDGVVETLGSREVDETIRGVLQEVFADLRREIKTRDWRGPGEPAKAAAAAG